MERRGKKEGGSRVRERREVRRRESMDGCREEKEREGRKWAGISEKGGKWRGEREKREGRTTGNRETEKGDRVETEEKK